MLITISRGLAERNWNPRSRFRSSPARSSARRGRPSSSAARQPMRICCSALSSAEGVFFRSRSSRSRRRSTTPRSARMSSSSIVWASRAGSIDPAGWGTDSSRKARITCTRASALRNGTTSSRALASARPAPAMSANSTVAGTRLRGLKRAVRRSRRSSGTLATPTLASLPCPRASCALVSSWKSVVFPVAAKPINPARSMRALSRPRRRTRAPPPGPWGPGPVHWRAPRDSRICTS